MDFWCNELEATFGNREIMFASNDEFEEGDDDNGDVAGDNDFEANNEWKTFVVLESMVIQIKLTTENSHFVWLKIFLMFE